MNNDIFLTGLISGGTILLGVFTADWLRRLRNRVERSKLDVTDIWWGLQQITDYLSTHYLESYNQSSRTPQTEEEKEFWSIVMSTDGKIKYMYHSTRWPQRNAKRINEIAVRLVACAGGNVNACGYSRTLLHQEERDELFTLFFELQNLVLGKDLTEYRIGLREKKQKEIQARMLSRERSDRP
jgi:hypothetical protein